MAVRAVLGQGLAAVDSASAAGELVRNFGRPLETPIEGLTHLFPRSEDLVCAELTSLGVAKEGAASVNALAKAVCDQKLLFECSRSLEHTVSLLRSVEGIGSEAAHYIAMRAFGEPDALPLDGRAMGGLCPLSEQSEEILASAERWRPWRAYAAMQLWAAGVLRE